MCESGLCVLCLYEVIPVLKNAWLDLSIFLADSLLSEKRKIRFDDKF